MSFDKNEELFDFEIMISQTIVKLLLNKNLIKKCQK